MPGNVDVAGRPLALRHVDWQQLFNPRTVAVVGASDTEGTQQRAQWLQVRDRLGARGATVVPVHPTKSEILGTPAYASVADIPFDLDLAIVLVRDPLPVLDACIEKGVGVAVVFAAGFSEVGTAEGRAKEAELRRLAAGPVRVMGPNTNLNVFEPWRDLPGKKMAIITQSGHQGRPISQGQEIGIAVQSWATIGNEADLEFADFVGHYAALPDTGVIAGYVEGFRDGRTLMLAADAAARQRVPIVVIKVGRSDEGRTMAQAHTGHLTGSDAVHDAVFAQTGVVRVDDLDEVIEIGGMFCHAQLTTGDGGVAIYALSGGTASHMVDLCSAAGLAIPRLEDKTIVGLREHIPWFLRCDNPVDSGGTITATPAGRAVLELLVEDSNTDVLIVPITGVFPGMSDALAKDLVDLHRTGRKTIIAIWSSPRRDDPAYKDLVDAGVPLFHSFCAAVRGVKALVDYSAFVRDYRSPFASLPTRRSKAAAQARPILEGPAGPRNEIDSKRLLAAYGIPVVDEVAAGSAAEAAAAARRLAPGGAVVMKVLSREIPHKSDAGLVVVGATGDREVRATYRRLIEQAAAAAPGAAVEAVVVQPLVRDVVAEAILGLSHQPPFGPTILYGLGGVFVEVFEDVAFGVPPFTKQHAKTMVDSTRGARLLRGARGRPAGDITALVDAIFRLQRLALEIGDDIEELDVNPLMVLPRGRGVVAVDALVVARGQAR